MAKSAPALETPFRRGEKVMATRDVSGVGQGTKGKIRLANGLGEWRRYWVKFDDGRIYGHISHEDLVRPGQLEQWEAHREQLRLAAERGPEVAEAAPSGGDTSSGGVASQIPAHILERSKAARARLLGS